MLGTTWVSSRIGAKKTLITGLAIIVVFSALAGLSGSIGGIVGFRAGWGLGNALFIATSLAVIVASASGGFAGAIVLYETALGLGIAAGPLVGGLLGNISWRGPFFGVAGLMAIAVIAAPRLQARFGTAPALATALVLFAADLVVIAVFTDIRWALITAVIVAGAFIGINNTLATQAVMLVSPVERPVASASYGFVRF